MNEISIPEELSALDQSIYSSQELLSSYVAFAKAFKEVASTKSYREKGYKNLASFVKGEKLPFGNCFVCGDNMSLKSGQYYFTCSKKCQAAWFTLTVGREEHRYSCSSCGKQRLPHSKHISGLCRACLDTERLLKRRSDIENIGVCLGCRNSISRRATRCRVCASIEKWKDKARLPEVLLRRKLRNTIGRRVSSALKKYQQKKTDSSLEYLGCSIEELSEHLEKSFTGIMSWENHGVFGWHIDHIRPVSSFDLSKEDDVKTCFSYKNLQPLWWEDNLKKGNKYEG